MNGAKTSTSSLLVEYEHAGEPLPFEGQRRVLVDSELKAVGIVEDTEVRQVPLGEVDLDFARQEGEGYESVASWREAHEEYWNASVPSVELDDSTVVIAERFRLVERLDPEAG